MKVDREELAWAAGFFDGEGHVRYEGPPNYVMRACVMQNDRRLLFRFNKAVGVGRVWKGRHHNKLSTVGCSEWYCSSVPDTKELYNRLRPFLSAPKKKQFNNAFKKHSRRKLTKGPYTYV